MKITNGQYEELKQNLHNAFISPNKQGIQGLAKEAALYYAEWWRREYDGGKTKEISLAETLNIPEYSDELYKLAKIGGRRLNIPIIIRQNTLWFRSLLIQGGLPMHHIQNSQEDFTVYRKFLKGLILHTQNVSVNWYNSSFIEDLSCTNYLPDSFKNEGIYELSLLIARAIYEENDELLPYDAEEGNWRELTNDLKESSRAALIHKVPFSLKWRLIKKDDNLQLSYYVEFAKKISMSYIDEHHLNDCSSFSLYVQSQYIATYIKTTNDNFIHQRVPALCLKRNDIYIKNISILDNDRRLFN